jgi:hypothetical protein
MRLAAWVLGSRRRYELAGALVRAVGRLAPWLFRRVVSAMPAQSFRSLYSKRGRL